MWFEKIKNIVFKLYGENTSDKQKIFTKKLNEDIRKRAIPTRHAGVEVSLFGGVGSVVWAG